MNAIYYLLKSKIGGKIPSYDKRFSIERVFEE